MLISNLAGMNRRIAAYVLRALDADAGRDEPTPPADEHALGVRLVELGQALQTRAIHRSIESRDRIPVARATSAVTARDLQQPWTNGTTAIYSA